MIPKKMETFLRERLPERTWNNRLVRDQGRCYLEFSAVDVERLARLGIEVDQLGPRSVVCMWDEDTPLEVGGYLVVDNLAMGGPAMGGIRMLPDITPGAVAGLARGMTLKNAAANLPFGGGKVGILAERNLRANEHREVVRRFARLLARYKPVFLPGPDVGTNDADMKIIAVENGLDTVVSKPADMGGSQAEQLGAAAGGLMIALKALIEEVPRLRSLSQFTDLQIPDHKDITVSIQGFGAVGAHTAFMLEQSAGVRIVGISDALGYLYDRRGLPVEMLFRIWEERGHVTRNYFQDTLLSDRWGVSNTKYSSAPNDLLREPAFCLIPASPVSNYLDIDESTSPTMTVDRMGGWALIIEGANTYSSERDRRLARARMEREVYRHRGVLIAPDFLVNSGAVIFAAQEQLIKTPGSLRIPDEMLGDRASVDRWLAEHAVELNELADKRRKAAEACREEIIRKNMRELVDLLIGDADSLPSEAAESISIRRIARRESDRTAAEIMTAIPTLSVHHSVAEAANLLIQANSPLLGVVKPGGELAGVVTHWDITRSTALGNPGRQPLEPVMTRHVVSVGPKETILEIVRKLELNEVTAMPVVDDGYPVGLVSADLLARRSLLGLLQSEEA